MEKKTNFLVAILLGICISRQVTNPDPYKGTWGGHNCRSSVVQTDRQCDCDTDQCTASDKYIDELRGLFTYSLPIGKCAGMFAESIQGVGGAVQFPKTYIRKAAQLVRQQGGVFISDEVSAWNRVVLERQINRNDYRFKQVLAVSAITFGDLSRMTLCQTSLRWPKALEMDFLWQL